MATLNVKNKKATKPMDVKVIQSEGLAKMVRENALQKTSEQVSRFDKGKDLETLFQQFDFTERFKYNLAVEAAQVLAEADENVLSVYQFGESMNPAIAGGDCVPVDPCTHLLCLVDSPSAALQAFIDALDRAVTDELTSLPTPCFANLTSALDISLITKEDVAARKGLAALLSSVHAPPLAVWRRI